MEMGGSGMCVGGYKNPSYEEMEKNVNVFFSNSLQMFLSLKDLFI